MPVIIIYFGIKETKQKLVQVQLNFPQKDFTKVNSYLLSESTFYLDDGNLFSIRMGVFRK